MPSVQSDFLCVISGKLGGQIYRTLEPGNITQCLVGRKPVFTDEKDKENRDVRMKGFGGSGHISSVLLDTLHVSFPNRPHGQSAANLFLAANAETLCKAEKNEKGKLERVYDYSKMVLAVGPQWEALVTATYDAETATFSVTREKQEYSASLCDPEDKVYVTVFDSKKECSELRLLGKRGEGGSTTIVVPGFWDKTAMYLYVFVLSKNKKRTSDSKCLYPQP